MKSSKTLMQTVLSIVLVSGTVSCSNDSKTETPELVPLEIQKETENKAQELIISLEKTVLDVDSRRDEPTTKVQNWGRKYILSEDEKTTVIVFDNERDIYGNANIKSTKVEYVVNDLCADRDCDELVSIITKMTENKISQQAVLFRADKLQYKVACKLQNTAFEQQEDALEVLRDTCQNNQLQNEASPVP